MTPPPPATPARSARFKTAALWGLVGVNAALLVGLVGRAATGRGETPVPSEVPSAISLPSILGGSPAMAQQAGAMNNRRPGEYLIIPGRVQGSSSEVVYIFDTANGELSAAALNNTSGKMDFLPKLSITDVFQAADRAQPRPGGRR